MFTCALASEMATQMLFFSAATAKAFTTFLAGFAFTTTTLPNISLLPAFVAGFVFNFSIAKPGTVNFPVDFTSLVATAARLASAFLQSAAFIALGAMPRSLERGVADLAETWSH